MEFLVTKFGPLMTLAPSQRPPAPPLYSCIYDMCEARVPEVISAIIQGQTQRGNNIDRKQDKNVYANTYIIKIQDNLEMNSVK